MTTKLILTIDDSIVEKAKNYSKTKGSSLSSIIENYLKVLVAEKIKHEDELSPIVKSLKSSFQLEEEIDYKEALVNRLSEKYL